jgi:hypothetical protein
MATTTTKTKLKPHEDAVEAYVAFRNEGGFLNAYSTKNDTLLNAELLGCISIELIERNRELKYAFIFMMRQVMREHTDMLNDVPPVFDRTLRPFK